MRPLARGLAYVQGVGAHPLYGALSQRGLIDPVKLAYEQCRLKLTASAFNRLSPYASSPDHRNYCYTELAVSFLTMAVCRQLYSLCPRRDGQAVKS